MNIIQNIHSIIAVVILVIVDLAAVIKGVSVIVKRAQSIKDATAEEKEAAKAAIIDNLRQVIFGWVTDAERELGEKTGKLKSAKVAGWIYENIPDDLKPLFTSQEIQDMIDDVLRDAQAYWDKNSKAREYIESGAASILTATAEISTVNVADGVPLEEIAQAVGEQVSAAIKDALETAQGARGAADDKEPTDGTAPATAAQKTAQETENDGPGNDAEN